MSQGGTFSTIYCTFIDRKNLVEYPNTSQSVSTANPAGSRAKITPGNRINRLSLTPDKRQLTSTFDFEIDFGWDEVVDIDSHDFIEFYTYVNNTPFQIGCGFIEDFVKKTSPNGNVLQGNGRDFLGQLFFIPYEIRLYDNNNTFQNILAKAISGSYLEQYLNFRGRSTAIVDQGAYKGSMIFRDVATSVKASLIQEYSEYAMNLVYQDRLGRMVVYGRSFATSFRTGKTLFAEGDINVYEFTERQNYSKVYSDAYFLFAGEENLSLGPLHNDRVVTNKQHNSDPRAEGLSQPHYQVFSSQDLVVFAGQQGASPRMEGLAKAAVRKSNQNLSMPVIMTDSCYYQGTSTTDILAWEIGQVWTINSQAFDIDREYQLIGIQYSQSADQLSVQLAFLEPNTLV